MQRSAMNSKTVLAMQIEAKRLRTEFEVYVEDLELFSKPEFWKAIKEPSRLHKNLRSYAKEMGV